MTKFQLHNLMAMLVFCFLSIHGFAQSENDKKASLNCDDPQATYNTKSDKCEYRRTKKSFKKITKLNDTIDETSGLIYYKGFIWTHNDSGGEAALYKIHQKTGSVIQKVIIENAKNVDWEDLTQDENHIYIGDFGNNYGYRKDLKIYKIAKSDIQENTTKVTATVISFSYPEQKTFSKDKNHNFDCEAFFAYNGELHLFTKNWNDKKTSHYKIPTTEGDYKAKWIETFDVVGLITAADVDANGTIVLIGYTPKKLFMWICSNYKDEKFFSGTSRRIEMGQFLFRGQLEGICFSGNGKGFISSEHFKIIKQHLRYFSLEEWLNIKN